MPKRPPRKRPIAPTPRGIGRSLEIPEVVGTAPAPKPAAPPEPEQRVGAGMTEQDILELVNNSYN